MTIQHICDGCKLSSETAVADGIILPICVIIYDDVISVWRGMVENPASFFVVLSVSRAAHALPMD